MRSSNVGHVLWSGIAGVGGVDAAFYLLEACLGLSFRLEEPRIRFLHPRLPRCIDRLELLGLRACEATVDVRFARHGVKVLRKTGEVEVSVVL